MCLAQGHTVSQADARTYMLPFMVEGLHPSFSSQSICLSFLNVFGCKQQASLASLSRGGIHCQASGLSPEWVAGWRISRGGGMEGEAGEAAGDPCLGAAAESTLQPFPPPLRREPQERARRAQPRSQAQPWPGGRDAAAPCRIPAGRGWRVAECHVDTCLLKQGWEERGSPRS